MAETKELTREIRDRRIAVAKDVIQRIDIGKLRVRREAYFAVLGQKGRSVVAELIGDAKDLQSCVDQVEGYCQVCAKGAFFLSKARVFNAVPIEEVFDDFGYEQATDSSMCRSLADIFDQITLDRIEVAFECKISHGNFFDTPEMIKRARRFGLQYRDSPSRCRAVAQNIVDNDGEFLP